jgi:four helix bundle protein
VGTVTRFQELEVWQTARLLTRAVYELSSRKALARDFGLRDQMRRSAVSIMSNIAEGFDSRTRPMFIEFLGRAKASTGELQAQLYVCLDVGYVGDAEFACLLDLTDKCSRQIRKLMRYLAESPGRSAERG